MSLELNKLRIAYVLQELNINLFRSCNTYVILPIRHCDSTTCVVLSIAGSTSDGKRCLTVITKQVTL